jgi:hypothetical protein
MTRGDHSVSRVKTICRQDAASRSRWLSVGDAVAIPWRVRWNNVNERDHFCSTGAARRALDFPRPNPKHSCRTGNPRGSGSANVATTEGIKGDDVRDLMVVAVEQRSGQVIPSREIETNTVRWQ